MAHTPGPWKVARKRGPLHGIGATDPLAIKDSTGEYVATLGGGSVHFANADANAHLIAAAPDLLAALKELTPNIRAIGRSDDLTPIRGEWMMKCLTRCEAAIARAEGN